MKLPNFLKRFQKKTPKMVIRELTLKEIAEISPAMAETLSIKQILQYMENKDKVNLSFGDRKIIYEYLSYVCENCTLKLEVASLDAEIYEMASLIRDYRNEKLNN